MTSADRLFHVVLPEDWEAAQRAGNYPWSTRGMTRDEVGFVHLSYEHQWHGVLKRFYADRPDAFALVLDSERLGAEVREEPAEEGGELFPHLYGPLPLDAVVAISDVGRTEGP
jgi:glutathione S-transferase